MEKRYALKPMRELWMRPEAKFEAWHQVELAVIKARVQMGLVDSSVYERIRANAKIDVARIEELEAIYDHDLIAFVEAVRQSLKDAGLADLCPKYHAEVTSYDIEDPALILQLRQAVKLILNELLRLEVMLRDRASEHQWTLMIANTHGQDAEPSTFGHLLLVYAEAVRRSIARLEWILANELTEGKLSGAVGHYADVDPELERLALAELGLKPARAETQILQRDRHALLLSALAVVGGSFQQMCETFWIMMTSRVGELREPRKPRQRGSSAMPHKRNPILIERGKGLPRMLRAYATAAMENIATPGWRDIAQSSVERHILPGATALTHYLASKLADLVDKLEVFPDRMRKNLEAAYGVWAGNQLRLELVRLGVSSDVAYEYVQGCSFTAADKECHIREVLATNPLSATDTRTGLQLIGGTAAEQLFDARRYVERGIQHLFREHNPAPPPVDPCPPPSRLEDEGIFQG